MNDHKTAVNNLCRNRESENFRKSLKLTSAQMAAILNVHPNTYSGWEKGKHTPPVLLPHAMNYVKRFKCDRNLRDERENYVGYDINDMAATLGTSKKQYARWENENSMPDAMFIAIDNVMGPVMVEGPRLKTGLSSELLAKALGVPHRVYTGWETNITKVPGLLLLAIKGISFL